MRAIVALRRFDHTRKFIKRYPDRPKPRQVLYYLHIGKTAGSFVTNFVRADDSFDVAPMPIVRLSHNLKYHHMPSGSAFLFGTRDPIARYVSGFNSRKGAAGRKRLSRAEKRAFAEFETANDLAEALGSGEAGRADLAQASMAAIGHVNAPQCSWFRDINRLEHDIKAGRAYRLRQEALNADLYAALTDMGFKMPQGRLDRQPRIHQSKEEFSKFLSPLAETNLRAHYAKDFAFLDWLDDTGLQGASVDLASAKP